ncbi:MAG: threonine-phosphate decarboxylase CobD [Cyanobacteria bacterium P01_G01_bin.67]
MNRPQHGGNLTWAASIAGCPVAALTDFSASINPLGTPQSAIAAIVDYTTQLTAYPDPEYAELRSHLAQHHQIPPEFILPGNGSAELLTWAGRELAQQKFTYLITPAFSDYQRALTAFGGKILSCPLSLETEQVKQSVSATSSRLPIPESPEPQSGLLLNNPHNPTGKLWATEEILPYLDQFELVVIDEAFMDFLTPSQEQSLILAVKNYPNLVILRSLTKFYSLPGLRIGYAIAHPERLTRWRTWRDPWSVNTLAVAATIAAIKDREFQQQTWDWLITARIKLFAQLQKISGLQPVAGAANYLLVKIEGSATKLQQKLLQEYQIVIRDCLSFPELGDRYFRIAVRLPEENNRLVAAITAIVRSESF